MNTKMLAYRAEALLVRGCLGILKRLPPATASTVGGAIARAIGPLIPTSNVADKNLRAAMPELSAPERKAIVADVWQNLGQTAAELACIGEIHEGNGPVGFTVIGWEDHVAPLLAYGGPSIFFTGHIANWEIIPPAAWSRGIDIGFMYRAASNPLVNSIILRLREANFKRKMLMFPKGALGARQAYAHLLRGGHLGMLIDQKLDNGIAVPFFGRPAMTAPALASFALKFKCPVFPVHVVRTGPARMAIICEAALPLPASGNKEADVLALTTAVNKTLERWIREKPGAWLWLHRRWPKEPK